MLTKDLVHCQCQDAIVSATGLINSRSNSGGHFSEITIKLHFSVPPVESMGQKKPQTRFQKIFDIFDLFVEGNAKIFLQLMPSSSTSSSLESFFDKVEENLFVEVARADYEKRLELHVSKKVADLCACE